MSRKGARVGIRYSLWNGIPAVYSGRSYPNLSQSAAPTFFEHFVHAFDEVLAPVHTTVEDLDLYLDPRTCPPDFLPWLSGWVGVTLNERWPLARRRQFVSAAAAVFRLRGTAEGLRRAVELYTGGAPVVTESGLTTWSPSPMPPLDPQRPEVVITVPTEIGGEPVDPDLIDEIAMLMVPAHVRFEIRLAP